MGFGGGTVLIMYLTLFANTEQKTAQGINLLFFLPCAFLSVLYYSKKGVIHIKDVVPYIIFGVFGALAGYFLLDYIPTSILTKLFGGFLILLGLKELFLKRRTKKVSPPE